jgi:hypothetical protein
MKVLKEPDYKYKLNNCDKGCSQKYGCDYCGHDCNNDCWYDCKNDCKNDK